MKTTPLLFFLKLFVILASLGLGTVAGAQMGPSGAGGTGKMMMTVLPGALIKPLTNDSGQVYGVEVETSNHSDYQVLIQGRNLDQLAGDSSQELPKEEGFESGDLVDSVVNQIPTAQITILF